MLNINKTFTPLKAADNLVAAFIIIVFTYLQIRHAISAPLTPWALGEYMINYEGGFVRRGLLGQLVFVMFGPDNLGPAINILSDIFIISFIFLLVSLFVYSKPNSPSISILVIFLLPGCLYTWITGYGSEYIDRKEIIFYSFLILFCLGSMIERIPKTYLYWATFLLSIPVMQIHEGFGFMTAPAIWTITLLSKPRDDLKRVDLIFLISYPILILALLLIATYYQGDVNVSNQILLSYNGTDIEGVSGGINGIGWTLKESVSLSRNILSSMSIYYFIYFLIFSFTGCLLLAILQTYTYRQTIISSSIFIFYFIMHAILFYSGWDFGRWISSIGIHAAISITTLGYFFKKASAGKSPILCSPTFKIPKINFFTMLTVYLGLALLTRMTHCCLNGPVSLNVTLIQIFFH